MNFREILSFGIGFIALLSGVTPVFAQTPPVTGIARQCGIGGGESSAPKTACAGSVNILPYVAPNCGIGKPCATTRSSAFPIGQPHAGDVTNYVMYTDATHFTQYSNDKHVSYAIIGNAVKQLEDTTWANSEFCTNGNRAFQKSFGSNGSPGIDVYPTNMSCGQSFSISGHNEAFDYTNGQSCTSQSGHAGTLSSTTSLIYQGTAVCNGQSPVNMIAMQVTAGAGAGEVFVYCNNPDKNMLGLCAWYERLDYSNPAMQPGNWKGTTDVCNLGSLSQCAKEYKGDSVNMVANMSQTKSVIIGIGADIAKFLGLSDTNPFGWAGLIKPANQQYAVGSAQFNGLSRQIADASQQDLSPSAYQALIRHDTKPKKFSMTSRECITHPQTGELVGDFVSRDRIETGEIPGLKQSIEGARTLSAMYANNEENGNYDDLEDIIIKTDEPFPCGSQGSGTDMTQDFVQSINQNVFGGESNVMGVTTTSNDPTTVQTGPDAVTDITFKLTADILRAVTDKNGNSQVVANETVRGNVTGTGLTPYMDRAVCLLGGCDPSKLTTVSYDSDATKNNLVNSGGVVQALFKNSALADDYGVAFNGAFPSQQWNLTLPGGDSVSKTFVYGLGEFMAAGTLLNCGSFPDGAQLLYLGSACQKDWTESASGIPPSAPDTSDWSISATAPKSCNANPSEFPRNTTTPLSEAITNATRGKIPACVLSGVATIEGASYEIASNRCTPNSCGAAGPFQLTVGYTYKTSGNACIKDTTCSACEAKVCPNALKYVPPGANPCDTQSAANSAVSLLQLKAKYFGFPLTAADPKTQKNAIIIAGDSYYGSARPIPRLGGLSYGEYVYKTCDPSYTTHRDHSFPAVP